MHWFALGDDDVDHNVVRQVVDEDFVDLQTSSLAFASVTPCINDTMTNTLMRALCV